MPRLPGALVMAPIFAHDHPILRRLGTAHAGNVNDADPMHSSTTHNFAQVHGIAVSGGPIRLDARIEHTSIIDYAVDDLLLFRNNGSDRIFIDRWHAIAYFR